MGVWKVTHENRYIWKKKRKEKKRKGGTQPKFELPTFSLEIPCSNHYAIAVVFSGFFFFLYGRFEIFFNLPLPLNQGPLLVFQLTLLPTSPPNN